MKYFRLLAPVLLSILEIQFVSAQSTQGKYVMHTLQQGETLSALAKEYNTNVGDIMRLNGMHADTKLVYGSKIKIPAAEVQTTVSQKKLTTEPLNPSPTNSTTHKVLGGETLYSISKQYNISMEQIKAWNNLPDDHVTLGSTLVVANKGETKTNGGETTKAEVKTVQENNVTQQQKVQNNTTNVNAQTQIDNTTSKAGGYSTSNEHVNALAQTESTPVLMQNGEGYFADQFTNKKSKHVQNISGVSKTFRTASGWSDGKYYILANNIDPGTIVKLTADNGHSVYAKVLWDMGDLKENAGLDFRISNATAAALNVNASSFSLKVSY